MYQLIDVKEVYKIWIQYSIAVRLTTQYDGMTDKRNVTSVYH